MLDVGISNLSEEARAAVQFMNKHQESLTERIKRFHGPSYDQKSGEVDPENHAFEYLSLYVPRAVYDNPKVKVGTRRPGSQADTAEAIQHGLNRWIKSQNLRHTLDAMAYDYYLLWAVAIVSQEPIPGMEPMETVEIYDIKNEELGKKKVMPHWPKAYRISPRHFFLDAKSLHFSKARFYGHDSIRDKDDLLSIAKANPDQGWNADVIEDLVAGAGTDEFYGRRDDGAERETPERNELIVREIFVPEHELEESKGHKKGFHGTIFTIGVGQSREGEERSEFIRKPRPFYGPKEGPYVLIGTYTVPDRPYPLSTIAAVESQTEDLNRHVTAMNLNADRYKRQVLVDAGRPDEAQKIAEGTDSMVIPVSNLDATKVKEIEIGGITTQHLAMVADKRDRLDRVAGMHDAQRGVVTGKGTATEVQEASESSDTRASYIMRRYQDGVASILNKVAWYLYYDDRVIFPLGSEAQQKLGMTGVEPWYYGGLHDPRSGATFEDIELEIEPHSMMRANEGLILKRTLEGLGFIMQAAPMMPQTAMYMDWPGIIADLGDALNMPQLGERINVQGLMEMMGIQLEMSDPRANQPRLGKDAGAAGQQIPYQRPAQQRELMGGLRGAMASGNARMT